MLPKTKTATADRPNTVQVHGICSSTYCEATLEIHNRGLGEHRLGGAVARGGCALGLALEVRLHIGAEMAGARDDALARVEARHLELAQRGLDIITRRKRLRERQRVIGRLGDARADMRPRDKRRIAHDRDASER